MSSHSESNGEKSKAGKDLKVQLAESFKELVEQKIILDFKNEENFNHADFSYNKQYLINFVIETLDNKFILINSSNSFRNDRFKQQAYDIQGVLNNSNISSNVIASIMLYPDSEIDNNSTFVSFREKVKRGEVFSPASHLLTICEFYEFLENHKAAVESEIYEREEIDESSQIKDGSYYGKAGNALEKEVVKILNNKEYLKQYKDNKCEEILFNSIIDQLCNQELNKEDIISILSTDTVEKLAKGGNAKTDVIIEILKNDGENLIKTLSIKKSKEKVVSCHDYKYGDFVRVLDVKGTKLAEFLNFFQANPSYSGFETNLPDGYTVKEFEEMLEPYVHILTQWALTGQHDHENLIDPLKQISNYLLIVKNDEVYCSDFVSYTKKIYKESKLRYGVPFSWTYPSKNRGKRIQLKMPLLI